MSPPFPSLPQAKLAGALLLRRLRTVSPANPSLFRQIHGVKQPADSKLLNTQIIEFMRCGLVADAEMLFDRLPHRNTVTWNSMVRGYFQNGELDRAINLFERMPARDLFSYNTVIAGLMQYGEIDGAKLVFDIMPVRDVVSWNSMIAGYIRNSLMDEAVGLFDRMPERNIISWNLVMAGLVNLGSLDLAERLYEEMPARDVASWTIMISGLAGSGRINKAREVFEEMPERDTRAWNAMIAGYIQNDRMEVAKALFMKMPERDLNSWNELINGLVVNEQLDDALSFFTEMPHKSPRSWNSILLGLVRNGLLEEAHAFFIKSPYKDIISWTNIIVGYFEVGDVRAACMLFRLMPSWDVTCWNATIFGLGENDCGEEGLKLFIEMKVKGFSPDQATFTSVLNISSILPSLDFGKQVHGHIIKMCIDHSVAVCNAIITTYSRCGSIDAASMAFSNMPIHDTISWNSIICGFSQHGRAREALELFQRMRLADTKPDRITFIGVLSACSHAGLIKEGQYYFNFMEYKCFLQPTCEHYTCIVDLCGRFGLVEEAVKFIDRMRGDDVEASASVWGALLGACRIHGKVEVGEIAGKRVLEIEPWNAGAYLMLAEIYLAGGRRRDAEKIWALMKERGVKKQPGCSWIDVKNSVHVFLAGDASHPEINEVYIMLDLLEMEM